MQGRATKHHPHILHIPHPHIYLTEAAKAAIRPAHHLVTPLKSMARPAEAVGTFAFTTVTGLISYKCFASHDAIANFLQATQGIQIPNSQAYADSSANTLLGWIYGTVAATTLGMGSYAQYIMRRNNMKNKKEKK